MTVTEAAETKIKSGKNAGIRVGDLRHNQLDWYGDKEYHSGLRNPWNVAAKIIRVAILSEGSRVPSEAADWNEWQSWLKNQPADYDEPGY